MLKAIYAPEPEYINRMLHTLQSLAHVLKHQVRAAVRDSSNIIPLCLPEGKACWSRVTLRAVKSHTRDVVGSGAFEYRRIAQHPGEDVEQLFVLRWQRPLVLTTLRSPLTSQGKLEEAEVVDQWEDDFIARIMAAEILSGIRLLPRPSQQRTVSNPQVST